MKENQAVRSEASFLIFRHASVAKACEAHEALTFWLLLGQAKSDKKRFIADALNDKESALNDKGGALNDRVEERAVHVGANLCVHPS